MTPISSQLSCIAQQALLGCVLLSCMHLLTQKILWRYAGDFRSHKEANAIKKNCACQMPASLRMCAFVVIWSR
jgi:hypothetical protein